MDPKPNYVAIDFPSLLGLLLALPGAPEKSDRVLDSSTVIKPLDISVPVHIRPLCLLLKGISDILSQGDNKLVINNRFILNNVQKNHENVLAILIRRSIIETVTYHIEKSKKNFRDLIGTKISYNYDENWKLYLVKPETNKPGAQEIYSSLINRISK